MFQEFYDEYKHLAEHSEKQLQESREYVKQFILPKKVEKERLFLIPEDNPKYSLEIIWYKTLPGVHLVSRGIVKKEGHVIFDFTRNFDRFWFYYIEDHPVTHKDYLLCGEDYQGYNVLNLTDKTNFAFVPKAAEEGLGWCPITVSEWDRENKILVVEGCYWASPFEQRTLDFSDPEKLPLPILKVEDCV